MKHKKAKEKIKAKLVNGSCSNEDDGNCSFKVSVKVYRRFCNINFKIQIKIHKTFESYTDTVSNDLANPFTRSW